MGNNTSTPYIGRHIILHIQYGSPYLYGLYVTQLRATFYGQHGQQLIYFITVLLFIHEKLGFIYEKLNFIYGINERLNIIYEKLNFIHGVSRKSYPL
jgi:hypothetical protein